MVLQQSGFLRVPPDLLGLIIRSFPMTRDIETCGSFVLKGLRYLFGHPLAVVASYQTPCLLELDMKLNLTCILKPVIMSKLGNQLRVLSKQLKVSCTTISKFETFYRHCDGFKRVTDFFYSHEP